MLSRTTKFSSYEIKQYSSSTNEQNIEFELHRDSKEALMCGINIDYDSPVELALMIKSACLDLQEHDIIKVIQQVSPEDWEQLKKNNLFQFINSNEIYNYVNIGCDIDKFHIAFMNGLGFE